MHRLTALGLIAALALAACTGNAPPPVGSGDTSPGTAAAQTAPGTSTEPVSPNPGNDGTTTDDAGKDFSFEDIPDTAAIKAAAQGLPRDPAEAASTLVDRMFDADTATASAATGELLRRAGLPIGSGVGPMVAMPDKYVITNAQIGSELLPWFTEQAREGMAYDLSQVQALLAHVGVADGALTDAQLVGTLAEWGKSADDPAESRTAGAAERALAAKHGQLLSPADMPDAATLKALDDKPASLPLDEYQRLIDHPTAITLDPIQVLLLMAHVAGTTTDSPVIVKLPPTADRTDDADAPHPFRRAAVTGPCDATKENLDTEPGKMNHYLFNTVLLQAATVRFGQEAVQTFSKSLGNVNKLQDVLSYLAFTLRLSFTVAPKKKTTTHFLHDEGPHANDVTFEAHAAVKPIVPEQYVDCFALAGVNLPSSKDLKDMMVIWSLPNGRVALKPAVVGGRQFDYPIPLDHDGKSTVQTTPRREKYPPKDGEDAPQSTATQPVKAELDKDYLKANAADIALLLFGSLESAGIAIVYKVVVAMLKEAGLPSETVLFPVTYHGSNVYHIFGDAVLSIPFYADVPLKADLYSCKGPTGPWEGSITVGGQAGPILQLAGKLAGYKGPASGEDVVKASFSVNPKVAQPQTFRVTDSYGVIVQLDQSAIDAGFQQKSGTGAVSERMRRIGWASWTIGGEDVRQLAGLIGGFMSQSLDLPVEAVSGDLRCKDAGIPLYENEFD